jgi:hypothetical protein
MAFDKLTESFAGSGAAMDDHHPVHALWQLSKI